MAETASLRGSLVGWERRPYSAFTDRDTGEMRPGGETLWLYVSAPNGEGPVLEVKVPGRNFADFDAAVALGFGCSIVCTYQLDAQNSRIRRTLLQLASDEREAA